MDQAEVLQAGLSAGMSAVSGFHSSKPNWVDASLAGKNIIPLDEVPTAKSRVLFLSATKPVSASPLCIGAWPWGDTPTWHWSDDEWPAVQAAWKVLYEAGINFIDTAQAYGSGKGEKLVGEAVRGLPRDSFVIQTKWLSTATKLTNFIHPVDAPVKCLKESLERLGLDYVDIYLVHGPIHPQSIHHAAEGMAKCVHDGLARAVGVANYSKEDMLKFADELKKYNVPLAVNQCEFSVLRRLPELSGNIAAARERGIVFQSYSSLGQGRLTGKYNKENPPPKTYRFSSYPMEELEPVLAVLRRIGERHGKSMASVALNYNISKGVVPLVGIRNEKQARDAVEALGWRLSIEDMVAIDKVSIEGKTTKLWQQG
ncbi:NADP-dependent oxidoreductase domain-containing protein [Echria macrotheca]|uniref:NADP-dependent oxidoreductase domain-containing protein n=1 Tax=Echria macrotheca TaxID=438768 RepID=A0AAJ0BP02_9PEZI|nr:NADP-dependent oxidoreductase domain-containing protein [Echria macrotheca]